MRPVSLAILVLAALAAGLVVAGASGTAAARPRAPAHVAAARGRPHLAAPLIRAHAPTIIVPMGGPSSCFIGGAECSEQPCVELIGTAARPTESCRAAPATRAKLVGRPNPATEAERRLLTRPGLSLDARLRLQAALLARSMVHRR